MAHFSEKNNILQSLTQLYITQVQFWKRFIKFERLQDPYIRVYDVCRDSHYNNKRVAVKDYSAGLQDQQVAVLQNLQSYRRLGQIKGLCKLIAFCKNQQSGDISAAFQFNDYNLEQLLKTRFLQTNRNKFYLLILKQILKVIKNAKQIGIDIEELIPSNILLYQEQQQHFIQILYDEREKSYDKIQQGLKVFASIERIESVIIQDNDYQNQNSDGVIFELGLLLLDIIYQYQSSSHQPTTQGFIKDEPLLKNNILHKTYYIFQGSSVYLNTTLINQKIDFILDQQDNFLKIMMKMITGMISIASERITLSTVQNFVNELTTNFDKQQQQKDEIQKNVFDSPFKQNSPQIINDVSYKKQDSLRYSDTINSGHFKQNITTNNLNFLQQNKLQDFDEQNENNQLSVQIPKQKLLSQIKCHKDVLGKLSQVIDDLQKRAIFIKKQYYDNSIYYGEINTATQKRLGKGIYVYSHGDIYFGNWKQNLLIEGTYIFKNGEVFEGLVKNGKQGWGRYYYLNGNIYEGDWKDDLKSGQGKMIYTNGDSYQGSWLKGKKNGKGKYYYNNGTIYEGGFLKGKKYGYGIITFPNQTKIEADWKQTHIEGTGKVYYNNGCYFQGNFQLSEKQGQGLYIWDNDIKYEGQFNKDLMQGNAKIIYSNQQYYEGKIKNGKKDGQGIYHYANGDQYRGEWKLDQKIDGQYKFYHGESFEGRFKKNQMSYGVMIYENGESYEGQFLNGQRNGIGTYRSADGQLIYYGKWQSDQFITSL